MILPISITAYIHGSVAFHRGEGLSLDGPLLYHATLEQRGEAFFSAQPTTTELVHLTSVPDDTLGLAIHKAGETWCYGISTAELHGDHGTELHHWNKRFDDDLAGQILDREALTHLHKVNTGSGALKSYHQPLYCEVVERLVWYALGDAERLEQLVPKIVSLGKKRMAGEGRVLWWEVVPVEAPKDRWLWRAPGVLARPVPLSMLPAWDGAQEYCAYRPPYWLPNNQTLCAVPNG
jgi:CRISPR type IV-associated protein Csf3